MSGKKLLAVIAAVIAALYIISSLASRSTAPPAGTTVEFIVTGSAADVTYGPSGSALSGSVPMDVTVPVSSPPPAYYAIAAQLQGGGTVSCKIKVGSTIVSTGRAAGGYRIASCEISRGLAGGWENDN
jgi:hypothetical protein